MNIPNSDPWYAAEIVPPSLEILRQKIIRHFGISSAAVGTRGNPATHFRGYHRSRNFVLYSPYCTNRTYSVQAAANLGGNGDWISAIDISLDKARLIALCKRVDVASRAGRIEKLVEWYGTFDGAVVSGWDNIENHADTSDDSHLWHFHGSLARSRAGDNHDDLFAILAGTEENEMEIGTDVPVPPGMADVSTRTSIDVGELLMLTFAHAVRAKRQTDAIMAETAGEDAVILTPEQLDALGDDIASQLVVAPDNGLTEADLAAVGGAVKRALREGTGLTT